MSDENSVPLDPRVVETKQFRKDLDGILQRLKGSNLRQSDERGESIIRLKEAIMWLGMDLKAMHEMELPGTSSPYPESYNPTSPRIEPTADGLKL